MAVAYSLECGCIWGSEIYDDFLSWQTCVLVTKKKENRKNLSAVVVSFFPGNVNLFTVSSRNIEWNVSIEVSVVTWIFLSSIYLDALHKHAKRMTFSLMNVTYTLHRKDISIWSLGGKLFNPYIWLPPCVVSEFLWYIYIRRHKVLICVFHQFSSGLE